MKVIKKGELVTKGEIQKPPTTSALKQNWLRELAESKQRIQAQREQEEAPIRNFFFPHLTNQST